MNIEWIIHHLDSELKAVEKKLADSMNSDISLIPSVGKYVLDSGGKRLRPLLGLLCTEMCGYRGTRHIGLASAIELIHTATLLHDDVVDHADLRRGISSVNSLWNTETSILLGDFMFSRAFSLMIEDRDIRVLEMLSDTCVRLAEGEILELSMSGNANIQEEDYISIITNKTAVLISAACRIGAILGEIPEDQDRALGQFGLNLGIAFQLVDDVLDYSADQEHLGKSIGKDLQEGKITLPIIHTLSQCHPEKRNRITTIIHSGSDESESMKEISALIHQYKGLEYTMNTARNYIEKAIPHLNSFPNSMEKEALITLSHYVIKRNR